MTTYDDSDQIYGKPSFASIVLHSYILVLLLPSWDQLFCPGPRRSSIYGPKFPEWLPDTSTWNHASLKASFKHTGQAAIQCVSGS